MSIAGAQMYSDWLHSCCLWTLPMVMFWCTSAKIFNLTPCGWLLGSFCTLPYRMCPSPFLWSACFYFVIDGRMQPLWGTSDAYLVIWNLYHAWLMLQHFDVIVLCVRAQCADLHGWFSFILLTKHHSRLIYFFFVCNYNSLVRSFGSQLSSEFFTGLLLVLLYVFYLHSCGLSTTFMRRSVICFASQNNFFWGKSFVPYQYSKIVFTLFPISFVI